MPHSLEVRFVGQVLLLFRKTVLELIWSDLLPELKDLSELLSALRGGAVNTEDVVLDGVAVFERVQVFFGLKMASVSVDHGFGGLVEEESSTVTLTEPLNSEPVERDGLKSLGVEEMGGPF